MGHGLRDVDASMADRLATMELLADRTLSRPIKVAFALLSACS
jgi:hypothetical protein